MRRDPYPVPPSRTWSTVMFATYLQAALAGALTLTLLQLVPQSATGGLTLTLWGTCSLLAGAMCMYGVARSRYRWEWIGAWGIVIGTGAYLAVTIVGNLSGGLGQLLMGMPTILYFGYAVGFTLGRAVQLSLIDMQARQRAQLRNGNAEPEGSI